MERKCFGERQGRRLTRFSTEPFSLVDSSPVCVNKAVRYLVRRFGGFICFTVAVPLHIILEAVARSNVSDKLVYIVGVFFFFLVFFASHVKAGLSLAGELIPIGRIIVAMVP